MTGSWAGGKGSRARPVDRKKWDEGWEQIFGPRLGDRMATWKDYAAMSEESSAGTEKGLQAFRTACLEITRGNSRILEKRAKEKS